MKSRRPIRLGGVDIRARGRALIEHRLNGGLIAFLNGINQPQIRSEGNGGAPKQ
jgi:hypothetical protein